MEYTVISSFMLLSRQKRIPQLSASSKVLTDQGFLIWTFTGTLGERDFYSTKGG